MIALQVPGNNKAKLGVGQRHIKLEHWHKATSAGSRYGTKTLDWPMPTGDDQCQLAITHVCLHRDNRKHLTSPRGVMRGAQWIMAITQSDWVTRLGPMQCF